MHQKQVPEYSIFEYFLCYDIAVAQVVKLVDTQDLKFCGRKAVRVRFPPRAQTRLKILA